MKGQIADLVSQSLDALCADGVLDRAALAGVEIERARDASHGDFATNAAMVNARAAKMNPRQLAEQIVKRLPNNQLLSSIEIAGPGFINFRLSAQAFYDVIPEILGAGESYGRSDSGKKKKVMVEFVSANPNGPLHVGHGRGAAYGAVVADLLEATGHEVSREYYVNDAGRQMHILATSVWLRYLELAGEELVFPANGYKGDYVWDIAATLHRENGDGMRFSTAKVFESVQKDEPEDGDKEGHIDDLIASAQRLLGDDAYSTIHKLALDIILADIKDDLGLFGVEYQMWFSEKSLMDSNAVEQAIGELEAAGHAYQKSGALWFRSTEFGDEKDRVLTRQNGQTTYFASDIAYHLNKFARGFERVINVWGSDHHGYVPRLNAVLKAFGDRCGEFEVLLVQFAILYRGGEKLQMSTRSGEFVTLRQLRKEVGRDAARYFYVMRKREQHLDFDLDLAKSQSSENPVYYVQYAHARICAVLRQAEERGIYSQSSGSEDAVNLSVLTEDHEVALFRTLSRYPELVESAAKNAEPHQLTQYLRELAQEFHTYYNAHQFLNEDEKLSMARIQLILAVRQTISNALGLVGVSAPESM